ncbi:late competence protein ComER [Shouchella shacheensis]|uniref:late competence protein ComER n=1 Tax=Shouchella shacheensis TaxID=1649580 RepID=UPI0007405245|nr:late competence protein ComER [Shouchella shacheensis]
MKVGFIGTGSMGTMLIESLLDSKALLQEDIRIINRTPSKAEALKNEYPAIAIASSIEEVARTSEVLFLCVKPPEMPEVLKELAPLLEPTQTVISITSPVSVEALDSELPCKTARIIPSILNRASSGSTLISYGRRCKKADKERLRELVAFISEPLEIEENITRVSSDIVSCGPAFFSYLAQRFIDGAVNETEITREDATTLATSMLIGLGKLLEEGHYTLPALQQRVCVPGGITGVGIAVLEEELGDGFDELFKKTHEKFAAEKKKLTCEFTYG